MNRGEKENVLRTSFNHDDEKITSYLYRQEVKENSESEDFIKETIEDSLKRLILPSLEREVRNDITKKGETHAVNIFEENLKSILLQPPLKNHTILGVDPAFRTGCKLAVIDSNGKFLDKNVIYPHSSKNTEKSEAIFKDLIEQHGVTLIAIGNGTASRETEEFVANFLKTHELDIPFIIVNEAGASVYSASDLAREEFTNFEVEERSAVSIARRIQDPLAELVKIDPKSLGVGQYQHDINQKFLNEALDFVVETAVNQVGINVNTASAPLLQRVSGLSRTVANNIVKMRNEVGRITKRDELKNVPRLGPKTYEQAIGFLRVIDGENPLDRTPIHPESYEPTKKLLDMIDCELADVGTEKLREKLDKIDLKEMAEQLDIGEMTLTDIVEALQRPERDPRDDLPQPLLQQNIITLEDIKPGMEMQGTVRNVVDFGAFVDIGVGQDGLVHISKLAEKFVEHPMDIVQVGDVVTVWVIDVDIERNRIALSMIEE